ncbi:MAG TPA: ribosome recycling factor [Hellea balneolensis]|uniref:Ribosome-recycling factor n=1 Tax=Hellea balneolensis TaxID=287478 RepID=A0A7C3C3E1_9PROT|nr:ribosome recycling factor [Hellea balneolensis]
MAENDFDMADIKRRMDGAITALKGEFSSLRTGRAHTAILDNITVEAYGAQTPLNQVGAINVPEPRMLTVNVWDKSLVAAVERALRESNLGINPVVDGQTIRIPMPPLTEERRIELSKVAGSYAEAAKVAVRNVRRDGMETLKRMEKDKQISEDELKVRSSEVQDATDAHIAAIDEALSVKTEEIMQV